LNGNNNPGFSAGLVVFKPTVKCEAIDPLYNVCGIISGYQHSFESVYLEDDALELLVKANSGIILVYDISNAIGLIDANPIGVPVPQEEAKKA
jgi:hypothetical protein